MSDDIDEKFRDVTSNGHDTVENDEVFRRRKAEEWDRAREQEHRLDFVISELRDFRRTTDEKLKQLVALGEQTLSTLKNTNLVLDRFMALANDHDKRIAALETRRAKKRK